MGPIIHPGSAAFLAQGAAGAEPRGWWDVLRHDVIPVAAAYLVFLGILISYRRTTRQVRRATAAKESAPGWGDLARYLVGTVAGGYVFFLAIVVVFYFVLGGEDLAFIRQALVEGSLLTFALVLPAFLLLTAIDDLRSRGRPARH